MDSRYYKPELSEVHVGFECEANVEGKWIPLMLQGFDCVEEYVKRDVYRVKYLDRDDIESLGFEYEKAYGKTTGIEGSYFKSTHKMNNRSCIWLDLDLDGSCDVTIHNNEDWEDRHTWFQGTIKNKSELKRVLKMIGYE